MMFLQVNPTVPATTTEQVILAVVLLGAVFAITAVVALRLRFVGLDDREARVVATVRRQLAAQKPGTVRIDRADDLESRRPDIRNAFETTGAVEDVVTLRQAYRSVREQAGETLRPYLEVVPRPARRFAALAVTVAVFGTVAVASESLYQLLDTDMRPLAPRQWPELAITESQAAIEMVHGWIATAPVVGTTVEWLFLIGILVGEWVYRRPWLFALLLFAVAARIVWLDRAGAERVEFPLPTPTLVAKTVVAIVGGGWAHVLAVIGVARVVDIGDPVYGGALTLAGVIIVTTIYALDAFVRSARGLVRVYRVATDDNTRGRLLVRLFGIGLAVLVAPVIPVWMVVAAGNVPELWAAFAAVGTPIQLAVVLIGVIALVAAGRVALGAADNLRAALKEAFSRRGWQAVVFGRGVPVGLVVLAYLLARPWGFSRPVSAVIGVVVGLLAAGLWTLSLRMRDRVELGEASDAAREVVVHAYRVETPGGTQFIARVNGTLVADQDRDDAVDAVIARAREAFRDRRSRPTMGTVHARMLVKDGVTDPDETECRVRAKARRWIEGTVRREYGVEFDRLAKRLERQVPSEIAREELRRAPQSPQTPVQYQEGRLLPA